MASVSSLLLANKRNEVEVAEPSKKRRNSPGMLYPDAEVITLSSASLMEKNKFVCQVCYKGFPREQNLELHKRGHNLPWKLKQRDPKDVIRRKVYLCPEPTCVHHDASHALGDLTGIKKHYSRKHGDKKYKCPRCPKMYAVESDLKAHSKKCGKKEYYCRCGTLFSRRDNFVSHRAFCEVLAEAGPPTVTSMGLINSWLNTGNNDDQTIQMSQSLTQLGSEVVSTKALSQGASQLGQASHRNSFLVNQSNTPKYQANFDAKFFTSLMSNTTTPRKNMELYNYTFVGNGTNYANGRGLIGSTSHTTSLAPLAATSLLQKAALIGSTSSNNTAAKFARAYESSSPNTPIDGSKFEKRKFPFGNRHFDNSDRSNGHDSNKVDIVNPFVKSGVGSSLINRNGGATYEQEDGHNGGKFDKWRFFKLEEQHQPEDTVNSMGFQQSGGVTLTRDFLGVVGEVVSEISSNEPQSDLAGWSFL